MHNRLPPLPHRSPVILNPLHRPLHSLGPPIRVRVERPEIDVLELQLGVEIAPVCPVVSPILTVDIKAALAPGCHEVVGVNAFDVRAHLVVPSGDQFGGAVCRRARQVAHAVGAAAGFVGEFPGEDRGRVFVPSHHCFDVAFEGCFDLGEAVELRGMHVSIQNWDKETPTTSLGSPVDAHHRGIFPLS